MSEVPEGAGELGMKLVANMQRMTRDRIQSLALENARRNQPLLGRGQSLAALRDVSLGEGASAVVLAAGPSLRRQDPLSKLQAAGYRGALVAGDSSLLYCLERGVIPDLVVTLDPHDRIVRWLGDPELDEQALAKDDYFRRQDLDDSFAHELETNRRTLDLLAAHGPQVKIALSTSSAQRVVQRVLDTGMQVYWWNPMLDDPDEPGSVTRELQRENRLPCVNAMGNVGSACWMMAHAVLEKRLVALTGMDFGYYDDTPYERTQYYHEAVDLVGADKLDAVFMRLFNPHTQSWFYTDPAYRWYRETFLTLLPEADCETWNCTEGGILFGDGLTVASLEAFLERVAGGFAE